MGKGDKKSKKGKISSGSFGVARPRKKATLTSASSTQRKPVEKEKEVAKTKTPSKVAARK